MPKDTLAERLWHLRRKTGMTQRALADATGADPSSIRNWEAGRNVPSTSKLKALADALGVSVGDLLP